MPLLAWWKTSSSASSRKKAQDNEKTTNNTDMLLQRKKKRRGKKQRDTRSVFSKASEDGSFPKFHSSASTPPLRRSHDMFSGFSGDMTPVSRVSTSSTVADSIWSTQSAPQIMKKRSMRNLFKRSSKTSLKWNKLEDERDDDDDEVTAVTPQQQERSVIKRSSPSKLASPSRLTTLVETAVEQPQQSNPVDLDDSLSTLKEQHGPVDLDDSVTSDDLSEDSISAEKEQQDDDAFLNKQHQHFQELDALVRNFEEGKLYVDDSSTDCNDVPTDYMTTEMIVTNEEEVEIQFEVEQHEESEANDEQLAAAVAAVAAEISHGQPALLDTAMPLAKPPRTPHSITKQLHPSPPQATPQTPKLSADEATQRFRLSPSFKEIVCPGKQQNACSESPYSQQSDVSSLSGNFVTPQKDGGPTFQHTAWIAPKTSYDVQGRRGEQYQPFEFVLTDDDTDVDQENNDIINPETQLSTQMMAMGQEILRKLTGNAVVHNEDNDVAKLPKGESPASAKPAKCLILLMDPQRRIFEVIPAFGSGCVADLLSQIPYQATDYRLKFQEYTGLCFSDDAALTPTDTVPSTWFHSETPLFAIPQHYDAHQIQLFGSTLLKNQKVIRMIHDHQVLLGMKKTNE